ncbi:MAG: hypothetical protein SOZ06_03665 [Candidatus Faecenecus gallistercoris]|nr:hypothetical protein [Bacillota bacterium]MDY4051046.1 hypothetical protein [Candidatus Faecenecus gallistercoris]
MKHIIVIFLIPIYLTIHIFKNILEAMLKLTDPIARGMSNITEQFFNNMYEFWSSIFKWSK